LLIILNKEQQFSLGKKILVNKKVEVRPEILIEFKSKLLKVGKKGGRILIISIIPSRIIINNIN
jgi:hypothetical protein